MCLKVFTHNDDELYKKLELPAMKLGSAFQKINFLRDINADYCILNRTYFPEINLEAFSNIEKKAIENDVEKELREALQGIILLPASARKGVYLAYVYYKKLFEKIKKSSAGSVMSKRFRVSNGHKFAIMVSSLLRHRMNAL